MKYLKCSLFFLLICMFFSSQDSEAASIVYLNEISIPSLKGTYISKEYDKETERTQSITKIEAADNVGGNDREIISKTHLMIAGNDAADEEWITTKTGTRVYYNSISQKMGPYKNYLQASKNSLTGAKFYGNWYI